MNESRKEFKWRTIKNHIFMDFLMYMEGSYNAAYKRWLDMDEATRELGVKTAVHYGKIIYKYGKTGYLEKIKEGK